LFVCYNKECNYYPEKTKLSLELRHLYEKPYLICCTTLSRKAVKEINILKWPVILLLRFVMQYSQGKLTRKVVADLKVS
jgi:hypothetical protein